MTDTAGSEAVAATPMAGRRLGRDDLRAIAAVLGTFLVVTVPHLLLGPNFVLDDWYVLNEAEVHGAWNASFEGLREARPGTIVVYGLSYGLIGDHPLVFFLVLSLVNAAVAVMLYLALRRMLPLGISLATTVLWLLLPIHTSLEVWAVVIIVSVSLLFLLTGVWVLAVPGPTPLRVGVAMACFVASALCYEGSILPAAAACVLVPVVVERRLRWTVIAVGAACLGAVALWLVTHWHTVKSVNHRIDLSPMFPAHFGWGVMPEGPLASISMAGALLGICVALVRLASPSFRGSTGLGERVTVAGALLTCVGTASFALYIYEPLGAGDRINYVSSIGAALVFVGIGTMLWRYRPIVIAAAVVLVAGTIVVRVERTVLWNRAGNDALTILDAVQQRWPEPPDQQIVLGPRAVVEQNIAAFLDVSNIDAAVQYRYRNPAVRATISGSADAFSRVPPERRLDIRPLSTLGDGG